MQAKVLTERTGAAYAPFVIAAVFYLVLVSVIEVLTRMATQERTVEMTASDLWVLAKAASTPGVWALAAIAFGTLFALLLTPLAFAPFAAVLVFFYALFVFVVRGTPVLLLALLVFYALASFWGRISPYTAGVVVLAYLSHRPLCRRYFVAACSPSRCRSGIAARALGLAAPLHILARADVRWWRAMPCRPTSTFA